MAIDNEDLVLDQTDPLARAEGALKVVIRLAQHADKLDADPMAMADGRYNRLTAMQKTYGEHAVGCALVAIAGDLRRIADQLTGEGRR